jgi:hypothetical protein
MTGRALTFVLTLLNNLGAAPSGRPPGRGRIPAGIRCFLRDRSVPFRFNQLKGPRAYRGPAVRNYS